MTIARYRFGSHTLDLARRELRCEDRAVALQARVFECLCCLIEHRDRAVGRDELVGAVFGRADVSDAQLAQIILRTRRAVGDDGQKQRPFPVEIPAGTPVGSGILDAQAAVTAVAEPCEGDECEPVPEATPISNRVPMTGLAGNVGETQLFSIEVPAGASGLSFISYGGSGDVSLLVSFGTEPTTDVADFRSTRPGNNETIRIATPQAGTYYLKVIGVKAFAGVTLQARHN